MGEEGEVGVWDIAMVLLKPQSRHHAQIRMIIMNMDKDKRGNRIHRSENVTSMLIFAFNNLTNYTVTVYIHLKSEGKLL